VVRRLATQGIAAMDASLHTTSIGGNTRGEVVAGRPLLG
jgi:hypothetical protein